MSRMIMTASMISRMFVMVRRRGGTVSCEVVGFFDMMTRSGCMRQRPRRSVAAGRGNVRCRCAAGPDHADGIVKAAFAQLEAKQAVALEWAGQRQLAGLRRRE